MKNLSMQIKSIQGNSGHKNNPLKITGKIIKCRQGTSREFKELCDEPSLKDGEVSVTMEVADLGITVNCFLVTPMLKKRAISTKYNTKAFFYRITLQCTMGLLDTAL